MIVTKDEINDLFIKFKNNHALSNTINRDHLIDQFLTYLKTNNIVVKVPAIQKQYKATLVQWQVHVMTSNPKDSLQSYIYGLMDPQIKISGTYENTEFHTHTSALISFMYDVEKQEGIIETVNSIYRLKGPEGDPVTGHADIGNLVNNISYD